MTSNDIAILTLVSIGTAIIVALTIRYAYRAGKRYAYRDALEVVTQAEEQRIADLATGTPVYQELARAFPRTAIALVSPIQDALIETFEWDRDESLDVALVSADAVDRWKRGQS
jgi:hypothetical protein